MKRTSAGVLALAVAALALSTAAHLFSTRAATAPRASARLMQEAEGQMVGTGYLQSLEGAYWALDKGPRMIPVLSVMLTKQKYYQEKYDFATGAFPFNALWTISHYHTANAQDALRRYYAWSKDGDALLALQGWGTRRRYGDRAGVLINDAPLYRIPAEKSKVIAHLRAGVPMEFIGATTENDKEVDVRGGPTLYDHVRVIRTRQTGYIQRASDDFDILF